MTAHTCAMSCHPSYCNYAAAGTSARLYNLLDTAILAVSILFVRVCLLALVV